MAHSESSRLTAVCLISSFFWLAYSLDRHSFVDHPRLSSFLLLLNSGIFSFLASFFSKWLPGADGRFDSEAVIKITQASLPQRPRRYYIPCIIVLIVLRLEILHRVTFDFQCTLQGIEAFVPLLLVLYVFFTTRRANHGPEDPDDMWGSWWEDFVLWMRNSHTPILATTFFFTYGVFLAANLAFRSTYICSSVTDGITVLLLVQWAGVIIDAVLITLLWRVLSWSRTTRSRIRTLSGILIASALATAIPWLSTRLYLHQPVVARQPLRGLDSLFVFDVSSTGLACGLLVVSGALWICESNPQTVTSLLTFGSGLVFTLGRILLVGTYEEGSGIESLLVLTLITIGFGGFTYANDMRSIVYIKRVFFDLILLSTLFTAAVMVVIKSGPLYRHPVDELVYDNRVEADRWLRHASVSNTLKLAVTEYKERHNGRDPPVDFDKWFIFAQERKSAIIDRFDQIEKDILPFWGMTTQQIKDGLEVVKSLPDVGIIKIVNGSPFHNQPGDEAHKAMLDDALDMISTFSVRLPDMSIAINLEERPRILAPWDDMSKLTEAGKKHKFSILPNRLTKRDEGEAPPENGETSSEDVESPPGDAPLENHGGVGGSLEPLPKSTLRPYVPVKVMEQLHAQSCPPGSMSRTRARWNVRDLCSECASPHSKGQFLKDWDKSLDPCHQPDIFNLHDFHTTPHRYELYQDLLPLFSRSKTDSFNDILMPLMRPNMSSESDSKDFDAKKDAIFWQGEPLRQQDLTHKSFHGGHRNRLVYLTSKVTPFDKLSMLFSKRYDKSAFAYEDVTTRAANGPLPFAVGFTSPSSCDTEACDMAGSQFGFQPNATSLDHRYVILPDTVDGPAPDFLSTLRSNSVPVLSSIFREWYTERLMPWVHFIPIDVRYHGLHSTMAYFTGLKGKGMLNGRDVEIEPHLEDAKWIAEQGRKWADKAIRREDMEVYMFRLLLEWGRVINDKRDELRFVMKDEE